MIAKKLKVAVVTGANRGIGYAIVKALSKKFDGDVLLTARSISRGEVAVQELQSLGYKNVLFHLLDVTIEESVEELARFIKQHYGTLDILINNAGIGYLDNNESAQIPYDVIAKQTVKVNFFGIINTSKYLFPLLSPTARVTNIICGGGHLGHTNDRTLRMGLSLCVMRIGVLGRIMQKFMGGDRNENLGMGWPDSAYCTSKMAVCCVTRTQQKLFLEDPKTAGISVNAVNPGYTDTDLTAGAMMSVVHAHKAKKTPDEAALVAVYVATEAEMKGQIVWDNKEPIDWLAPNPPEEMIEFL